MKIKDIVTLTTTSITPQSNEKYHLYSLPSFDDNQKRAELIGSEIQSNKYTVPDKCILFNKLNVRFKRVWRIDNNDYNKICSTEFLPLVVNESKVDYQYCYYILISDYITNYLCGQNANTSGSHKRIDPTDFLNIELPTLPAMEEQKRIGQLLYSLDQKIALNRAINDNLEAMAKQIYDYWFIQFDFPNDEGKPYKSSGGKMVWNEKLKREIPEGWDADALNTWLEIKSGFPFKSETYQTTGRYKVITIKNVQDGELVTSGCDFVEEIPSRAKEYIALKIGDRLISLTGNCGRLCVVCEENLLLNQRVGLLSCNSLYLEYLYNLLNSQPMRMVVDNLANGAAQANLSPVELCKTICTMPQEDTLLEYNRKANVFRLAMVQNNQEIAALTKQRDDLLPLLMNGQVSVNYHLSKSYMRQFVYSYYHSLKNTMKQKFIHSVLQELSKVLDSQQLDFVENTLEQKLLDLDIIEQVTNEELVSQENEELLTAFLSAKKIEGCSAKTIKYYKSTINHLFDEIGKTTAEITTNDIRSYLAYYQEQKQSSKVTIDNMRRIFSSFFSWLEDEDYIVKSPVRRIHKVRTDTLVKEVINDECMELLRDNCTEIRDLAMIDLLASTGMRVGELVQMNIEDIDFQERQCKVFGKGNKEREVYFNARAKIHLQQYVAQRRDDNPALFVSLSSPHQRLSISGVEVRLRTLGKRLNLSKIHPHKFRRTLATMAIDKGMPIEQVQRLLGHVKIDTTLHYAMVNQNNVKIAHRRYIG